jgi:hypothetical protein
MNKNGRAHLDAAIDRGLLLYVSSSAHAFFKQRAVFFKQRAVMERRRHLGEQDG